jgi:hypothetical protein
MRHRSVTARAVDGDAEHIGRGEQGASAAGEHTMGRIGHDMQCKCGVGQRVDQTVVEHEARAVMAFLARLKHELHRTRQLIPFGAQQLRRADQHRDMGIVAASVHRASCLRFIIEAGVFLQRQRIHVPAQQHGAAVRGAFQRGDETSSRRPLAKFERQSGQRGLYLRQRLGILKAKFGLAVNIAAQRNEVGEERVGAIAPAGVGQGHGPD